MEQPTHTYGDTVPAKALSGSQYAESSLAAQLDHLGATALRIADQRNALLKALRTLRDAAKTLNERHPDFIAALNIADRAIKAAEGK